MKVEYVKNKYGEVVCLVWDGDVLVSENTYEKYNFYRLPDEVKEAFKIPEGD